MKPFVKWAGGKRQIIDRIMEFINDSREGSQDYRYIEPFLGGGAVFFHLQPKKAIINDLNEDLINAYEVIKSDDYLKLCEKLEEFKVEYDKNEDEFYYELRSKDRTETYFKEFSKIDRAARMIFLNRTCYNGLYRVNSRGEFNTPIGRYKNPTICDRPLLTEIHEFLSSNDNEIVIMNKSYEEVIAKAKPGDIIYIDPPYDYEDDDGFTKYQMKGFTFEDFIKLKKCCDVAINKGAYVILSNNATEKVIKLFEEDPIYKIYYDINPFQTLRTINCQGNKRKTGLEVIIYGVCSNLPLPQANDILKVIKLLSLNNEDLKDKKILMEKIQVSTERQIAYYLSALQFLKYINHNGEFTEKSLLLNKDNERIENDVFNTLREIPVFEKSYNLTDNKEMLNNIVTFIKEEYPFLKKGKFSESTIKRRASTIKAWVSWMHNYNDKRD